MNADTRLMLDLQAVDLKIIDCRRELEQIPVREQEIQQELEQLKQLSLNAHAEVRELERRWKELEGEVEASRTRQRRLRQQQLEVKTNKEYQAILGEIEFLEKEVFTKEDTILEMMDKAETARREAEQNKRRFEADSVRLATELKRLTDSAVFLNNELTIQIGKRGTLAQNLPPRILATYDRLSNALGGMALSRAKDELCQVCHVRLRPQMFQEIRTSDAFFQCENCSRILYHIDD